MRKKLKKAFLDWRERAKANGTATMEQFVEAEIAKRDWITYTNPIRGIVVEIERSLANAVLLATKGMEPEPNEMDVLSLLADFHIEYKDVLARAKGEYKTLEIILRPPMNRRMFLFSDEGKLYVCDTPIIPFADDNDCGDGGLTVTTVALEWEEYVFDSDSKKHKTGVLVRADKPNPLKMRYGSDSSFDDLVDSPEFVPYPTQLNRPKLTVMVDGDGIYKPLAYNRWGLVGNFLIVKRDSNGRCLSMTDEECDAVAADLASTRGYLDPTCRVLNAFREPFATHGEPPRGYVPETGAWFK